jgi:hypothetical protein
MDQVWDRVLAIQDRGFDGPEPWLQRPGVPPGEFPRQLLRSIAEVAGWAARCGCDLDDADDRARLSACLAAVEGCLVPLRVGLFEAMTREAK